MKRFSLGFSWAAVLAAAHMVCAETVKDREGAVRKDKATMENDARWIYNDLDRGFAAAKKSGKPLLVVLRCVPCLSCAGIDAQVLEEAALVPLLDQFVCVRLINANALDLPRFQFDFDLSFSTMFFHPDGTTLGRYGSWTHQKDAFDRTTAGFQRTLEAVLKLHRQYPVVKAMLGGKQGGPVKYQTPVEMPTIAGKYQRDLDWQGKVVQSCVHCHQIGDAMRMEMRSARKPLPDELIYPFPMVETVGFSLAPDQVARVSGVVAGSIAAQSGIRSGDDLVSIAGHPVVSVADVSWALHRAESSGTIPLVVQRGGAAVNLSMRLPEGWRRNADISRRVGTWPMRGMAMGGLVLTDASAAERAGVPEEKLALLVKSVGQYGLHAAAKNAGFQKGDLIVDFGGMSSAATESQLIGHVLRTHMRGEKVKVVVLRNGQRVELQMPMQ